MWRLGRLLALSAKAATLARSKRTGRPRVIAIVGAGHVGLVCAAGFAELGHQVRVVDSDRKRIAALRRGKIWFFEPGLPELLARQVRRKRLAFTPSHRVAFRGADFVFVCVPTPATAEGSLDDSYLRAAFGDIHAHASMPRPIIVTKSTVPVGTGDAAAQIFDAGDFRVVSNPEFLAEGRALEDFFHPSRIVIGAHDRAAGDAVAALHAPLGAPIVRTDPVTAELSKLAANAFLATKISFANAVSRISEAVGANGSGLLRVLSLDPRIGPGHLRPGLGYGGSCLPKDLAAIEQLARRFAGSPELFAAVGAANRAQGARVVELLVSRFGSLAGRRVAVLGVSFKANTDDTRESPGLALARQLRGLHADVVVYDPVARSGLKDERGRGDWLVVARSARAAARRADALVVASEWPEFAALDLVALRRTMRGAILVDGRGILDADAAGRAGFQFFTLDGVPARADP